MNLLDILKDQVSGSLVSQASKFLGESESGIGKAMDGIFPSLLGKVINSSEETGGAQKLLDMASGMDDGILDNIGDLFGGGAGNVAKLMNSGSGVLNMLLGNSSSGFIDKIAGFSGLKGSAASSLLKMAAPFLMSMIGRHIKNKALDAVGLGKWLGTQKQSVKSSMPGGLLSSLGSGFLGKGFDSIMGLAGDAINTGKDAVTGAANLAGDAVSGAANLAGDAVSGAKNLAGDAVSGAANLAGDAANAGKKVVGGAVNMAGDVGETAVKTGGSLLKWLLPILGILLVASYFGFKTGCSAVDNTVDATKGGIEKVADGTKDVAKGAVDLAGDAANAVGNVVSGAFATIDEAAKKTLDGISFAAGSVGSQMMDFVNGGFKGNANFRFSNLTFATGSANITEATRGEVDNLAAILKAYPDLKITVTGYTDNTGDAAANMQLSKARAMAVKARLMSQDIDGSRIATDGKGAANPVGSNDTEEGRKQNRRIEVTINS